MRGGLLVASLLGLCVLAAVALRSLDSKPEVGKLLVARPRATDPTFDRTVVLLVREEARGMLGVILNRTSPPDGYSALREGDRFGGPVSRHRLVVWEERGTLRWRSLEEEEAPPPGAVSFTGLSGWATGQLEAEIRRGSWWVTSLDAAHVLGDPEELWWKASAAAD